MAAGRRVSSEAISTLRLPSSVRRLAILAVVVVLPEPCRPTIMMATGAGALRSIGCARRAERRDKLVVHDLDDHLAGRDRLDHVDADRALLHLVGERARDIERDVGLEQRAPHLAQRRVDVRLRQRPAPGQAVEDCAERSERLSNIVSSLGRAARARTRVPSCGAPAAKRANCARGRIALSGGCLRPPVGAVGGQNFRSLARTAGK